MEEKISCHCHFHKRIHKKKKKDKNHEKKKKKKEGHNNTKKKKKGLEKKMIKLHPGVSSLCVTKPNNETTCIG